MDFYSASGIPILWCCFFQTIAIGWIFGARKFGQCVEQMTGYKPSNYWIITWGCVAPLVMAVSVLFCRIQNISLGILESQFKLIHNNCQAQALIE